MPDALGLIEINGLSLAIVALDALDKAADVRLVEVELNDQLGAVVKFTGDSAAVGAAVLAAEAVVAALAPPGTSPIVSDVINAPDPRAWRAVEVGREYNPLLEADVVYVPENSRDEQRNTNVNGSFALGLIETQGLTAVMEAIDTAAKAADVEVVAREKLGGGYVTVIIKGDVAAVKAAVEAGKGKVEGLGKLIAAHVIARPSDAVLSLLPKT